MGKFSHGIPLIQVIEKMLRGLKLNGEFSLRWLSGRHVLIIYNDERDFSRLWMRSIWVVNGLPMRIFKWSPSFNIRKESPVVPIWVRLPGLSAYFF